MSAPQPTIAIAPESLHFESVIYGSSDTLTCNISNAGQDTLVVSTVTPADPSIQILPTPPYTLAQGESQQIRVILSPIPAEDMQTSLTIRSNDPNHPEVAVPVRTTVRIQPGMGLSSAALDLGEVVVGSARDSVFTIRNTGNALLTGGVRSRNSLVSVFPDTITLEPGQSRSIRVSFTPKELGFVGSVLVVSSNADEQTVEVTARGVTETGGGTNGGGSGDTPTLSVLPQPLDFGTVRINETPTTPLFVENKGEGRPENRQHRQQQHGVQASESIRQNVRSGPRRVRESPDRLLPGKDGEGHSHIDDPKQ